jgi:CIC family chloride channel protein
MHEPGQTEGQLSAPLALKERDSAVDLLAVGLVSLVVGAGTGVVSAAFRLVLTNADRLRDAFVLWARGQAAVGFCLAVLVCAAATALAAWLVRRFSPHASGSGIPHVESVLREELPPAPPILIPIKFFGGVLAIGSGLALGREGPSVQMGATIGNLFGEWFRLGWRNSRVLLAAGAGAGLAAAFNAPVAGAIFVLEELTREFELHTAIAAIGASATAISVSQAILGNAPDFHVGKLADVGAEVRGLYFLFGFIAGGAAVLYCEALLLGVISLAQSLDRRRVGLYAALTGAVVGALAWLAPDIVGGGDAITQNTLLGTQPLAALLFVFFFRFGFGAVSYATATPGGIFAPMLVLGAQLGLIYGRICQFVFPGLELQPVGFAVVGMAAFFTGVVRAPLTGIVLATEMTANVDLLLPMLGACFAAMLAPSLLRSAPIYDSLRELALQRNGAPLESVSAADKPAEAPRPRRRFPRVLPLFGVR